MSFLDRCVAPLLLVGIVFCYFARHWRRMRRLPPGPPGLPILGNVLDFKPPQWIQMTKWSKQYGPLYSLNLLGTPAIVINNHVTGAELLDKRSAIYSDRPRLIMTGEIICGGLLFPFMGYGPLFNKLRRATWEALKPRAAEQYIPIQEREAILLVEDLGRDSEHWSEHVKREVSSITISFTYGIPPLQADDPIIQRIAQFDHDLEEASRPGEYLVDLFPWLNYLPPRMAKFKREGRVANEKYGKMFLEFYRDVQKRMAMNECDPCVCSAFAENPAIGEVEAAWNAGVLFGAGSSTTSAVQHVFVLAMLAFPEVMVKAQNKIDEVVGRGRLPDSRDRDKLPYIYALIRECLRWRSTSPIGLPHMVSQDDIYEGYLIPKGTVVFYNLWAMNSDPDVYPDPDEFRPERFLDETETKEVIPAFTHGDGHLAFGYGRRICVGSVVALQTLFVNFVTILWAFNIEKAKDTQGNPITPDVNNFIDHVNANIPAPFPASFVYRHPDVPEIIAQAKLDRLGHLSNPTEM